MSASRRRKEIFFAKQLHLAIGDIVHNDLRMVSDISFRVCEEIVMHHLRDMDRLYAIHHELVHPTKHCSYLAFWIRKLKPISNAFPTRIAETVADKSEWPIEDEVTDVNEIVALLCAFRYLHDYIAEGLAALPTTKEIDQYLSLYGQTVANFFNEPSGAFDPSGNRGKALIYDMRFRTFGPHHLTHTFVNIMRELVKS